MEAIMGRPRTMIPNADAMKRYEYYQKRKAVIAEKNKIRYQNDREFICNSWKIMRQVKKALQGQAKEKLEQAILVEAQREFEKLGGIGSFQDYRPLKKNEKREFIENYKKTHNICADCKQHIPVCALDFDHVRGMKLGGIADLVTKKISFSTLQAEMEKCELVCANCHRIRTFNRTNPSTEP